MRGKEAGPSKTPDPLRLKRRREMNRKNAPEGCSASRGSMDCPPGEQQPQRLDYRTPTKGGRRWGLTLPARIGAGVCCVLFPLWALYQAYELGRGRIFARHFLAPSILLCFVASAFCLLAALGVFGKHRGS